jgi:hypothetical protein
MRVTGGQQGRRADAILGPLGRRPGAAQLEAHDTLRSWCQDGDGRVISLAAAAFTKPAAERRGLALIGARRYGSRHGDSRRCGSAGSRLRRLGFVRPQSSGNGEPSGSRARYASDGRARLCPGRDRASAGLAPLPDHRQCRTDARFRDLRGRRRGPAKTVGGIRLPASGHRHRFSEPSRLDQKEPVPAGGRRFWSIARPGREPARVWNIPRCRVRRAAWSCRHSRARLVPRRPSAGRACATSNGSRGAVQQQQERRPAAPGYQVDFGARHPRSGRRVKPGKSRSCLPSCVAQSRPDRCRCHDVLFDGPHAEVVLAATGKVSLSSTGAENCAATRPRMCSGG